MSRKYLICYQGKKDCLFRTLDIQLEIFTCNFYKEYWNVFFDGDSFSINSLLRRACEWIKIEEARLEFICEISRKKVSDLLENVQVGESVFCRIAPDHEVKLLEKPLDESEFVSCEAPDGRIVKIQVHHLRRISKGDYYGEYFINGPESEKKAQGLIYKANYYGFRAQVEKKDNGCFLKIYGDSQQDVDNFINLSLEQDFDISPYV